MMIGRVRVAFIALANPEQRIKIIEHRFETQALVSTPRGVGRGIFQDACPLPKTAQHNGALGTCA